MPILSIIITSRNTEKYIAKAIKSITEQKPYNWQNIEIIVVDDGSSDNTLEVIKQIHNDHLIIVRNSETIGLGASRNVGISESSGNYISYLDGDDYFASDYLEVILPYLYEGSHDMILFNYSRFYDITGEIYSTSNVRVAIDQQYTSAWNKIVKRSIAEESLFLQDNIKYEDVYYTIVVNNNVQTVALIPDSLYYYRRRQGSLSFDLMDTEGHKDIAKAYNFLVKKYSLKQLQNIGVRKLLNKQFFTHMMIAVRSEADSKTIEDTVSPILVSYHNLNNGIRPIFGVGKLRWVKNVVLIQFVKWHWYGLTRHVLSMLEKKSS